MDMHAFEGEISVDEVKKAHTADKAVQDRYGVKYHQFWANSESGIVFCLAEGPDKETLEKVHQTAHGNIACNIVEVEPGFLKLFMGDDHPIEEGMVLNGDEAADPAYRYLILVDILPVRPDSVSEIRGQQLLSVEHKKILLERIVRFRGRVVEGWEVKFPVGVFDTAVNAVRCAKTIKQDLMEMSKTSGKASKGTVFRIGLAAGYPVTETGEFFSESLQLARKLCLSAPDNEVLVSSLMSEISNLEDLAPLRPLTPAEETFLTKLFEQVDSNISNNSLNVDYLGRAMGVSRAQLYRKCLTLTGRSPNEFVSSIRMEKALTLIKNKFGNVSEVALEVGYNNPSYFSKCFHKTFHCTPSRFIRS